MEAPNYPKRVYTEETLMDIMSEAAKLDLQQERLVFAAALHGPTRLEFLRKHRLLRIVK